MNNNLFLMQEAEAMKFVADRHSQQSYGDYPYFFHLYQVALIAKEYNCNETVQLAAWLHDALEDTNTSPNDLVKLFGQRVAKVVYLVTDAKGWNRKERHENTYPALAEDPDAVEVKQCDRIGNGRFSLATTDIAKMQMYVKEHDYFVQTLGTHDYGRLAMWAELDDIKVRMERLINK